MNKEQDSYRVALKDDASLAIFLRAMSKFDQQFCEQMASRSDFTLRMEVRGNRGELLHCRVSNDGYERPPGVEKRIDKENRRK